MGKSGFLAALLIGTLAAGCGDSVPRAEYEKVAARLAAAERELEDLKNGAPRLLALAESALGEQRFDAAESGAKRLLELHPQAAEADRAKVVLSKAQEGAEKAEEARARAAEEAKRAAERKTAEAKREREKAIAAATRSLRKNVDEVSGLTFYSHKDAPRFVNSRTDFGVYFAAEGEQLRPLRLRIVYVADSWLFIERFIIKADDLAFTIDPGFRGVERDHGSGDIWEWYDRPMSADDQRMLMAVLGAKKVTLRFEGKQYRRDRVLTKAELQRIEQVITAYNAML